MKEITRLYQVLLEHLTILPIRYKLKCIFIIHMYNWPTSVEQNCITLEVPYLLDLGDLCTRGFWSTRQEDLGYRQGMAQAAQARIPAQTLAQIPEMGEKSTPADPP